MGLGLGVEVGVGQDVQVVQAPTPYLGALADVDVVELLDEVLECDPEGAWLGGRVRVRVGR